MLGAHSNVYGTNIYMCFALYLSSTLTLPLSSFTRRSVCISGLFFSSCLVLEKRRIYFTSCVFHLSIWVRPVCMVHLYRERESVRFSVVLFVCILSFCRISHHSNQLKSRQSHNHISNFRYVYRCLVCCRGLVINEVLNRSAFISFAYSFYPRQLHAWIG